MRGGPVVHAVGEEGGVKVLVRTADEVLAMRNEELYFGDTELMDADLVVADGVVVKSRDGKPGARIEGCLVAWDDEEEPGEVGPVGERGAPGQDWPWHGEVLAVFGEERE